MIVARDVISRHRVSSAQRPWLYVIIEPYQELDKAIITTIKLWYAYAVDVSCKWPEFGQTQSPHHLHAHTHTSTHKSCTESFVLLSIVL